jgi:hypothetical protein
VPGFSGSTAIGVAGADCDHRGRANPRTLSRERTSADRLSDVRSSRREEDKREYLEIGLVLDCALEFLYFVPEDFASWRCGLY